MADVSEDIPRDAWRAHFDEFSRTAGASEVTLEVAGPDVGDQIAAERLTLTGITYDDKDDILVVGLDAPGGSVEEYEHIVSEPRQIQVATLSDGETTYDVTDSEGRQHLIRVRPAPELPSA
jgi:Family of unknown function (DUF5335)